jgi:uncharacterized protein with NRDE domain
MCLIALAWQARRDLPLLVAANRDEWRERPTKPAHWWPERPDLLAGRDLQAGGTWMGVTRAGRFAAVTNFRDPSDKRSTARSRGTLVTEFLVGGDSPARFLSNLSARAHEYNGFNLIVGDGVSLFYFGSREGQPRAIEPGIHAISNHLLDEPWPKVVAAQVAMDEALETRDPVAALFQMLSDPTRPDDEDLPGTGVGLEWERRLGSALITGDDYGTRASTVLAVTGRGEAIFEERTRGADGSVTQTVREAFTAQVATVPAR